MKCKTAVIETVRPPTDIIGDSDGRRDKPEPEAIHLSRSGKRITKQAMCGTVEGLCTRIPDVANCTQCVIEYLASNP